LFHRLLTKPKQATDCT